MLNKLRSLARMFGASPVPPADSAAPVLFDSDVFLVSYPKSGNTWMRFLLANYITGGRVDLSQSNRLIPDIHYNPQDIVETLKPRIIKTHYPYTAKFKRVVYIVRDGRDVAVSYFHHLKKFGQLAADSRFSNYLESFIKGTVGPFGQWGAHVNGWLDGGKDVLFIRYEDMLADTPKALESVVRYCGLEFNEKKLIDSVTACSLSELRQIEKRQFSDIKTLSTSDPNAYFFRKGISGDWRNVFSDNDTEQFLAAFSVVMNRVGYGAGK
jgi:hypothetical protein